jgi:hypothetical protein
MEMMMMLVCNLVLGVVALYMCFANSRLHRKNEWLKSENKGLTRKLEAKISEKLELANEFGRVVNENIKLQLRDLSNFDEKIDKIKAECCRGKGCPLNKE